MLRQILVSLLILALAGLAFVFLVPGAPEILSRYGISLPFGQQVAANAVSEGPRRGFPGGFAGSSSNVITSAVTLARINDKLQAVGEGSPVRSVTVMAKSGGTLVEVPVRAGQTVRTGDVIARFNSDAEQLAYSRARLAAEDADATLKRTRELATSNTISNATLAEAELAASTAELALRDAELNLEARTITSPIDGTVGIIRVSPGNYVSAQDMVTTIDDTSSILVNFWVPERYAGQLEADMPLTVTAAPLPGQQFEGSISAIDSRIDPASRTLQVQAEIPNAEGRLRAGMSLNVSLDFPGQEYPAVDPLAVLWSTEGSYVWQLENGAAKKVMADIVERNSDGVLVEADLEAGDIIITEGILQLSEGTPVTVLEGPGAATGEPQRTRAGG